MSSVLPLPAHHDAVYVPDTSQPQSHSPHEGNSRMAALPSVSFLSAAMGGLDSYLERTLRPVSLPPDVQTSSGFSVQLEQAAQLLDAKGQQQSDGATALNRAARLLHDELSLRGLAHMYRGALLQG